MSDNNWNLQNVANGIVTIITKSVFKVGRNTQADLITDHREVSRNHATLSILIDGFLYVTDNKSSNGTFVNGVKIKPMELKQLKHGDIVGFGWHTDMCEELGLNFETPPLVFKVAQELALTVLEVSSASTTIEDCSEKEKIGTTEDDDDCVIITASVPLEDAQKQVKTEPSLNNRNVVIEEPSAKPSKPEDIAEEKSGVSSTKLSGDIQRAESEKSPIGEECFVLSSDEDEPFESSQIFAISKQIKQEQTSLFESVDPYSEIKQELEDLDQCGADHQIVVELTDDIDHFESTADLLDILEPAPEPGHQANTLNVSTKEENQPNGHQKYVKPPIIAPHFDKKSIPKMKKEPPAKIITKRKSTSKQKEPETNNKKPKMDGKAKTDLAEERKKRLRELATKPKTEKLDKPTKASSSAQARVKTSDGRGGFLLHEIDVPAPARGSRDPRAKYGKPNSIQDTTVSSNLSPSSDEAAAAWREPPARSAAPRPDSTGSEDRSGIIWKLGAYRQTAEARVATHASRSVDDLNEDIYAVVCWSVKWLLEQGGMDASPPVNGDKPLMRVPLCFRGFADYEALMNPLVKLELWQFIYQTTFNKEDERTPIKARILHERKIYPVCCLDCELFLSDAENRANLFRPEDFSLIEIRLKDCSGHWYQYTSYGFLKSVQRSSTRDGHHVKLTIITKHYTQELFGTRIFIKVIANIGSYLRLIRAMKYLEVSPLCKYVIKPDNMEPIVPSPNPVTNLMPITLNRLQHEIVADASHLCLKDGPGMYLVKGPPGTGKSTVIVGIVMEMLLNNRGADSPPLILLTAPSNAAVDSLILKLNDARSKLPDSIRRLVKLVRIGPDSSISQNVNRFKLDVLARNNIISCKGLSSLLAYKESVEKGEDSDAFLRQHLGQHYAYELRAAEDTLLMKSNVVCTTLNSCVSHRILQATKRFPLKFTCCIIDEATQCNELESLLPIQLGIQKFVLVGDPKQLPAVVCNKEAHKLGFGQSLFFRIQDNFKNKPRSPVQTLCDQYRMNPEICEYPNKTFYENKLRSLPRCSNPIEPALKPYLVFNLTRLNDDRSDYINADEVHLIKKLLETLSSHVRPTCAYSIGIITPYRAQKNLITQSISGLRMNPHVSITVNTVDSFQGMENDVIIISSVRNKNNNFLQNEQRLNVALTRAKQALYVIGNYALFKHCKPLYDLREDAKKRKLLLDIQEDPRNIPNLKRFILKNALPYNMP